MIPISMWVVFQMGISWMVAFLLTKGFAECIAELFSTAYLHTLACLVVLLRENHHFTCLHLHLHSACENITQPYSTLTYMFT